VEDDPEFGLSYRLCPRCGRAVPATSKERYCINDGEKLLQHCPACHAAITSPYTRFCAGCGLEFTAESASLNPFMLEASERS
jgi:predicted amidophosphoribosyltransferase